jgi:hypothetical protein
MSAEFGAEQSSVTRKAVAKESVPVDTSKPASFADACTQVRFKTVSALSNVNRFALLLSR